MCTCGKTDWCPKNGCLRDEPSIPSNRHEGEARPIGEIVKPLLEKYRKKFDNEGS